ncbi:hypothetical protein NDU88_002013 [Pleurodeles waltl]|uniref:Uncharacterized protein n=1 Tax=Pleurodeles waltl TaxID=8319 RepID=A0AAV7KRR1_PLEWA|nr:hypothetical protein NDU88_002013 [Pleurodeles waltl]
MVTQRCFQEDRKKRNERPGSWRLKMVPRQCFQEDRKKRNERPCVAYGRVSLCSECFGISMQRQSFFRTHAFASTASTYLFHFPVIQ